MHERERRRTSLGHPLRDGAITFGGLIGRLRSPRGAGLRRRTCGPISNRFDPLDRGDNQPAIRGAREGRDPALDLPGLARVDRP
jgi:hypothetical protein